MEESITILEEEKQADAPEQASQELAPTPEQIKALNVRLSGRIFSRESGAVGKAKGVTKKIKVNRKADKIAKKSRKKNRGK